MFRDTGEPLFCPTRSASSGKFDPTAIVPDARASTRDRAKNAKEDPAKGRGTLAIREPAVLATLNHAGYYRNLLDPG